MRVDWRRGRVAFAAFFAALLAYLSNGSLFPLNADTAPNVYLPVSLLGDGDLAFSPFEAPFILARPPWRALFTVAIAWSIFVQALGVFVYSPRGWNTKALRAGGPPAEVDQAAYRGRLWSFRDWQIGYLIANFHQARAEREHLMAY